VAGRTGGLESESGRLGRPKKQAKRSGLARSEMEFFRGFPGVFGSIWPRKKNFGSLTNATRQIVDRPVTFDYNT
jgi:hypothetical protein